MPSTRPEKLAGVQYLLNAGMGVPLSVGVLYQGLLRS